MPADLMHGALILAAMAIPAQAVASPGDAQDNIIVTATRVPTPSNRIGSSVTVITAEDIENYQFRSATEALQSVPSLSVIRNGGPGKLTSIFSRGTNANHTLVMIDGIEINDPSNTDGRIDLSHLYIGDVERIEVLHGPQSTLYGSDAIGAVIQIFTRKGRGETKLSGTLEGGSFNTFNQYAYLSGARRQLSYTLNVQHTDTDGVSALSGDFRQPNGKLDDDGNEGMTLSSRLVYDATEILEFDFSGRYTRTDNDLDLNVFPVRDDSDSDNTSEQVILGLNTRLNLFEGRSEHRFGINYTDIDRRDRDDYDPVNSLDYLRATNKSRKLKFELQNDIYLYEANTFTLGMETEKDKIDASLNQQSAFGPYVSDARGDQRNNAIYIQDQFNATGNLSGTAGVRHDKTEDFSGKTTWRLALSWNLPASDTRLKGSWATGFKAPTLTQLYGVSVSSFGPFTGNPDLDPETSRGWELGFEQALKRIRSQFGATYYRNDIDNLITFDDTFTTNINRNKVRTYGVEAFLKTDFSSQVNSTLSYSYTRAVDRQTDQNLQRRPLQKAVLNLAYTPRDTLGMYL
ncbi:MAG TPA: TonB-dependent receptor, partial [Gammaproteobacteria bacterium]|nr:TonB-dependent receptor [Gammaproteobacteria bacterium]